MKNIIAEGLKDDIEWYERRIRRMTELREKVSSILSDLDYELGVLNNSLSNLSKSLSHIERNSRNTSG